MGGRSHVPWRRFLGAPTANRAAERERSRRARLGFIRRIPSLASEGFIPLVGGTCVGSLTDKSQRATQMVDALYRVTDPGSG